MKHTSCRQDPLSQLFQGDVNHRQSNWSLTGTTVTARRPRMHTYPSLALPFGDFRFTHSNPRGHTWRTLKTCEHTTHWILSAPGICILKSYDQSVLPRRLDEMLDAFIALTNVRDLQLGRFVTHFLSLHLRLMPMSLHLLPSPLLNVETRNCFV